MNVEAAAGTSAPRPKERRKTVEAALAAVGLVERSAPPVGRLGEGEHHAERLRVAIGPLGPAFAAFGLYLSSRRDLLSKRECAELSRIPEAVPPAPPAAVAQLLTRELGAPPSHRFHAFDAAPFASTLLYQEHAAWLAPGAEVTVRIVRPGLREAFECDLPLLALLAPHLPFAAARLTEAIADFAATIDQQMDLLGQAESFTRLDADARATGAFHAPVCYRDYSSRTVLTLERVSGVPIGRVDDPEAWLSQLPPDVAMPDPAAIARRLMGAWLRQALEGHLVPCQIGPRDVVLSGDRLVYVGGVFEPQTADGRARFISYLNAVALDDPDTACEWVMSECESVRSVEAEDALRRRFRQAVPFRDGETSGDDSLADQLLVQWRVTSEAGWRLRSHLLSLYRGLHGVAAWTEMFAPGRDELLLALQDIRLRIGLNEAQQLMNPAAMTAALDRVMTNMVNLPQRLDEVLTLAAEGRLRLKLHMPAAGEQKRIRNHTVSLIAGLAVLASLVFLFRVFVPAPAPVLERVGAIFLLLAGLWLLKSAAEL